MTILIINIPASFEKQATGSLRDLRLGYEKKYAVLRQLKIYGLKINK